MKDCINEERRGGKEGKRESFSVFIVFSFRSYQKKVERRGKENSGGREFVGWPEYMYTPGEIPTQICFVREIPKRF